MSCPTLAHQAPLSMGFARQEYWNGMPFSPLGDLPDPGIKSRSSALQADSLLIQPPVLLTVTKLDCASKLRMQLFSITDFQSTQPIESKFLGEHLWPAALWKFHVWFKGTVQGCPSMLFLRD